MHWEYYWTLWIYRYGLVTKQAAAVFRLSGSFQSTGAHHKAFPEMYKQEKNVGSQKLLLNTTLVEELFPPYSSYSSKNIPVSLKGGYKRKVKQAVAPTLKYRNNTPVSIIYSSICFPCKWCIIFESCPGLLVDNRKSDWIKYFIQLMLCNKIAFNFG